MRMAEAGDYWRHLYEKSNYRYKINKLEFENLKGVGNGHIEFSGGITAICGANGVGKTTLLNAISTVLESQRVETEKTTFNKLNGSRLTGQFSNGNSIINRQIEISSEKIVSSPEKIEIETVWIDCSIFSPKMISIFSDITNLSEMLEAEDPIEATKNDLKFLSYIVGKDYEACATYELEMGKYGVIPYFEVTTEGVKYSSEAMGLGEIAVHFILWNLKRVNKNSIVLIEEPETYLVPRSQEALLDVIAAISYEKRLWVIITSHSPSILRNIPMDHIRLLARIGDTVEVITPTDQSQYFISLGIKTQKRGVILVEDRCAREFSKCWLGRYSPSLLQQFEIIDISSKENIIQQLETFPNIGEWFKIFGLFDGDQREEINNKFPWSYSFLPTNEPPEMVLKKIAKTKRAELALAMGRDLSQINLALSSLEGKNYHDWIVEFPRHISAGYEQLISVLFELSMADETMRAQNDDAFKELVVNLCVKY